MKFLLLLKRNFNNVIFTFLKLTSFFIAILCFNNIASATLIKKIKINGLDRIEKEVILQKLKLENDTEISDNDVNNILKELYKTEYFSNIYVHIKNNVLFIDLTENPVVNEVILGGISSKIGDSIKGELELVPRGIYNKEKIKKDSEKIKIAFQKSGKLGATVIPKIEILPRNRVNVLFDIKEGLPSRVDSITFLNNTFIGDIKLTNAMSNKGASKVIKLFQGKIFEEDSIETDKSAILQVYLNNGYANAAINYVLAEYDKQNKNFLITFDINESKRYVFGEIAITSEAKEIDVSKIPNGLIKQHSGDLYRYKTINKTISNISSYLSNNGYAFILIEPKITKDEKTKRVNVIYQIKKSKIVYINKINIYGTTRTNDYVVRREILLTEGDLYDKTKIERSKVKLNLLGYFDRVEIKEKATENTDRIDLDVIVQDRTQTGNLSFSIGYSTYESFILSVGLSKNNILGLGYSASLSTTLSFWRRTVSLGFNNPHFLGTDLNLGFDVVYNNIDPIQLATTFNSFLPPFRQNTIMTALRLGYKITDRLFQSWSLQYRYDDLGYVNTGNNFFSSSVLYQEAVTGQRMSTSISQSLNFDRRDNQILPNRGYFATVTTTVSLPLPNQVHYFSVDFFGGVYIPLFSEKWVLSFLARAGTIVSYDQNDIPFQYKFTVGYFNMRGFYFTGIGPHVAYDNYDEADNFVGTTYMQGTGFRGTNYYVGTVELRMPTPFPKEYGLHFVAFMDVGGLFGVGSKTPQRPEDGVVNEAGTQVEYVVDSVLPRLAIGGGILWMSPMGPIRLEFAQAIIQEVYDIPLLVRLHFSATPI